MDIPILIALAASVLIIILGIAFFFKTTKPDKAPEVRPRAAPNRLRDGAPRRAQVARNRGLRMRAQANQEPAEVDSDNENDRGAARDEVELDGKLGAKKRAKLEAKAEKKAQREAEEKSRADKRQRQEKAEQERKKLEEQEKAEEKLREEEERKVKEEKDKREYDEYLKMKEAFSVEEEGYEEGDQDDQRNVLQEFVDFVKNNKVVVIEDLAAQFKLKTQACIDRIKDLQADDILTGVIDDRGKFIYVSQAEMEAVAKFIRQRGRVSITELAENSNYLINLTPSAAVN